MRTARTIRALAIVLLGCTLVGSAQKGGKGKAHKRDVRSEVEAADKQWSTAQQANDPVAMEKLLSEDYLCITSSGQLLTKAQQLDRMRSRAMNITRLDMTDEKVKLLGNSGAIITSQAVLEGTLDGHAIHGNFRSTRGYRRVGGVWQMTTFQATPERTHDHEAPPTGR